MLYKEYKKMLDEEQESSAKVIIAEEILENLFNISDTKDRDKLTTEDSTLFSRCLMLVKNQYRQIGHEAGWEAGYRACLRTSKRCKQCIAGRAE